MTSRTRRTRIRPVLAATTVLGLAFVGVIHLAASGHEWTANAERGVYKTTDGGTTWAKVLYVNEKTGA
jgi:hypothetical protein